MITDEQLENWFTHHPPQSPADVDDYKQIREAGLKFALLIRNVTPSSADQSSAIRSVRQAVMTANSAIACKGE